MVFLLSFQICANANIILIKEHVSKEPIRELDRCFLELGDTVIDTWFTSKGESLAGGLPGFGLHFQNLLAKTDA